jgi:hypothetical protein
MEMNGQQEAWTNVPCWVLQGLRIRLYTKNKLLCQHKQLIEIIIYLK